MRFIRNRRSVTIHSALYLHYVFDLWAQAWRRKRAHGDMIVVRFADDIVLGFQRKADADQFRTELTERMRKFKLELHPAKTRLLEFGPYAIENRKRRGEGKPETFNFLGYVFSALMLRQDEFRPKNYAVLETEYT